MNSHFEQMHQHVATLDDTHLCDTRLVLEQRIQSAAGDRGVVLSAIIILNMCVSEIQWRQQHSTKEDVVRTFLADKLAVSFH